MSVLIKGMEMPGKCENCPCYDYIDYVCRADDCFAPFDVENPEERSEHCPGIEIPTPHGRLIDADRLLAVLKSMASTNESVPTTAVLELIDHQPVVLKAELSE